MRRKGEVLGGTWGYKRLVGACVNYPLTPGGAEGALDIDSKAGSPLEPAEARMRTRAASIAILFNLLGATWGVTRKKSDIKLKWLQDEVKDGHKLPHMEITFADGSKDEIFLKEDPENDCFYHGSLKSDIESEVEVDGCKDAVETIIITSRLVPCGLVILLLENSETYSIDPTEGRDQLNSTDSVPGAPAAAGAKYEGQLPHGVVAKIHVRYDESLVRQYGTQQEAEKGVRAIIDLSRPWFKKRRNGLLMEVEIKVLTLQYYAGTIPDPALVDPFVPLKGKGANDPNGYPTAWFRAHKCSGRCTAGKGHMPGFCRYDHGTLFILFHCIYIEQVRSPM